MSGTNSFLSLAFIHTSSANALLLLSLHVVWSALGGVFFLHDKLPVRTVAMVLVRVGSAVAVFLGGSHDEGGNEEDQSETDRQSLLEQITGDLLAVLSGLCFACLMLLFRSMSKHTPNVSTLPTTCLGSSFAIIVGLVLAGGDVSLAEPRRALPILFLDVS